MRTRAPNAWSPSWGVRGNAPPDNHWNEMLCSSQMYFEAIWEVSRYITSSKFLLLFWWKCLWFKKFNKFICYSYIFYDQASIDVKPAFELKNRLINVSFLEFSNIRLHILFLFFSILLLVICVTMCKFANGPECDIYSIAKTFSPFSFP